MTDRIGGSAWRSQADTGGDGERGVKTMEYDEWLEARIEQAETSGELWMLDPLAIKRAWEARTE